MIHVGSAFPQNNYSQIDSLDNMIKSLESERTFLLSKLDSIENELKLLKENKQYLESSMNQNKTFNLKIWKRTAELKLLPDNNSKTIEKIALGTYVTVLDHDGSFWKVKYNDKIGYIEHSNIEYTYDIFAYFEKRILEREKNEIEIAKISGKKLVIKNIKVTEINSSNGVNFKIDWIYLDGSRIIKYIDFTVRPFNAVGDVQKCEIRDNSDFIGRVTGPIKASDNYIENHWEAAWYNSTICCIELIKVRVIYTNDTSYTYYRELPSILTKEMKNSCKYIPR